MNNIGSIKQMDKEQDFSEPGKTSLSQKMRKLAEIRTGLPEGWHKAADDFDAAAAGFYANPPTVTPGRFVGCFARARRLWCEATGEPLISEAASKVAAEVAQTRVAKKIAKKIAEAISSK